jgi:serine/threonine protein kinase
VRDAKHTNTAQPSKPLGKYQLLERVGMGAFGAVWKARDTELDRLMALKVPHTGVLTETNDLCASTAKPAPRRSYGIQGSSRFTPSRHWMVCRRSFPNS